MSHWHHSNEGACELCEHRISTEAHPILIEWFREKKLKYTNLHVSCAYRGEAEQNAAYRDGASNAMYPNSAHNKRPARALDLFLIDEDGMARFPPLFYARLNAENVSENRPILWGGRFKIGRKGSPDMPHFELISPKESTPTQLASA